MSKTVDTQDKRQQFFREEINNYIQSISSTRRLRQLWTLCRLTLEREQMENAE